MKDEVQSERDGLGLALMRWFVFIRGAAAGFGGRPESKQSC